MHFKWDSNVARDIANELNRLEEDLNDCAVEIEHGSAILREMQAGQLSKVIEGYVSLAEKMKKSLIGLEERFHQTVRGINTADEMFESIEQALCRRAVSLEETSKPIVVGAGAAGIPPVLFGESQTTCPEPVEGGAAAPASPWLVLPEIRHTVAIDQVSLNSGMATPFWLESIIDANN